MKHYNFSIPEDKSATIQNQCIHCGEHNTIVLSAQGLADWQGGMLIQDAFPELHRDKCEIILTGIHDDCWNEMFPK
jgi:hypothetical protein